MMAPQVKRFVRFFKKRAHRPQLGLVADSRDRRGRRWALPALLNAVFIGMVAFETSFRGVERLTRDLEGCRRVFGIPRRVPDSTLARVLSELTDEAGLRKLVVRQIRDAERRKALTPVRLAINMVMLDGQTLWCSDKSIDDPACQKMERDDGSVYYRLHALHAVLVSAASLPCIDQLLVRGKTNEMGEYQGFVSRLHRTYGRSHERLELIANDAGMTSADNAAHTHGLGLAYVMAVKKNQPTLFAEAERLCGWGEHKQMRYVCEISTPRERYRGAWVRRDLYRSRDIEGWPAWESARQLWRVKQTTQADDGTTTVENRYFITNLAWGRLKAHEILAVVRAMWGVENGCHWTLDVQMKQDTRCWCTKGKAQRLLSWLRLLAYNTLGFFKYGYLRSESGRSMPWDDIRRSVQKALTDERVWVGIEAGDPSSEAAKATL
jgi:predicted transposase YbfD/YdcC